MKATEKLLLQCSQALICSMMKERNAGTEDCISTTDLARDIGIPREYIADYLVSIGLLRRVAHRKKASKMATEQGYAMTRVRYEYNSKGRLTENPFPVWTPKGVEHIKRKLKLIK